MSLGDDAKVSRPAKLEEGVLVEVLQVAAPKGDVPLAEAAWALLERSLALPNAPDFPSAEEEEEEEDMEGDRHAAAPEAAAAPSGQQQEQQGQQAAGAPAAAPPADASLAVPCVAAFHALIHTYSVANDLPAAFTAVARLEAAHPEAPGAVSYHGGLPMLVDMLARGAPKVIDEAYFFLEERAKEVRCAALCCAALRCAALLSGTCCCAALRALLLRGRRRRRRWRGSPLAGGRALRRLPALRSWLAASRSQPPSAAAGPLPTLPLPACLRAGPCGVGCCHERCGGGLLPGGRPGPRV